MFVLCVHRVIFFLSLIYKQDQQGRDQKHRDAKEWEIQTFWREREKEREIEFAMQQTREKEKEKYIHDRELKTELLTDKEKQIQRLDQQSSSHDKNAKGLRNGMIKIRTAY